MRIRSLLLCLHALIAITASAQVTADELQLIKAGRNDISLQYPDYVKEFYKLNGSQFVWMNSYNSTDTLLQLLQLASDLGLNTEDYQFDFIKSFRSNQYIPPVRRDTLLAELRFTDAAIHIFRDIAYGNRKPALGYNGLSDYPDCLNIPELMAAAIKSNRLSGIVNELEPDLAGYRTLNNWLIIYNQRLKDSLFKETKIISTAVNSSNQPLLNRLYYLGIVDSLNANYSVSFLKSKVRSAQRLFNLLDDGVLHKLTIEKLNVPVSVRIAELKNAINAIRWLRCLSIQSPVFVVNIPSATLLVVHNGNTLMESKLIVGKRSTPTPTLASTITEVILYPYWSVPHNIATRELLPLIQRNAGYLEANNMQVLNKAGKIVDPGSINWNSLSPSNFPYALRQSTGCDNSLGIVKLNFYSPYSVYLHDTPWKVLFNLNRRYFSHGCMRVEKALELAHFLLKENTIAIDTLGEKGCIRNQAPVPIPVKEHTPVIVLYNTAWFDSTGIVQFNEDIYRKINFDQISIKRSGK